MRLLILAPPLLAGCLSLEAPANFLVVERSAGEIKAITPDEARLWVREFADGNKGDLSFWSQSLQNDLTDNRGYTLIEEREVKDSKGRAGRERLFEVTAQGAAHRYLVTIFVLDGWFWNTIRVAEFVATRNVFGTYVAEVRKAVETLSP